MPLSTHPDLADLIVRNVKAYAIVVLSEDGVVPEWSGDTQAVTGYAAGDIVGRSFDILFTKPDRAAGVAAQEIELALRDGRAEDSRWHPCDRRRGPGRDFGRRLVEILGLRRPALHQIGGQDDIGPHLQKFALPVLEQGGQKGAAWSSG